MALDVNDLMAMLTIILVGQSDTCTFVLRDLKIQKNAALLNIPRC